MSDAGPGALYAGGAVPLDRSDSYVDRSHDAECFSLLTSNRWVLLLGPRQQGKTSAIIRLANTLGDHGYVSIYLDMQAYAAPDDDYSSMLRWLSNRLARSSGRTLAVPDHSDMDDLEAWLERNLPDTGSIAVLIDEVGAVPEAHRIRFFSQLRALYNSRAAAPASAMSNRLVFLFAGTFRPERMIATGNSPFNVSEEVRVPDLDKSQVAGLLGERALELAPWIDRVYVLTGGQPYLSQRYLGAVIEGADDDERERLWARLDDRVRRGEDRHLTQLFSQVIADPALSDIVARVAAGQAVDFVASNDDHLYVQVLGVCKERAGRLVMRNALYQETAAAMPQLRIEEADPQGSGFPAGASLLVGRPVEDFACVADQQLRDFAIDSYRCGVNAYRSGDYRFALAAFGGVLEALLLDYLEQLPPADRTSAIAAVASGKAPSGHVRNWSFVQLVDVAHNTEKLAAARKVLSHQVRDWRNLVHPDKARRDFQPQERLEAEVRMAVAVTDKVLQELATRS